MVGSLSVLLLRLLVAVVLSVTAAMTWAEGANPKDDAGRFLYAGDDDWDWASPLGAAEKSGLSKYGEMPWSALDWAEEGLTEVRGVLVGTPPNVGNYLTMEELGKLRGAQATYEHFEQSDEVVLDLLASDRPPNVIILMQDTGRGGELGREAVDALAEFVKGGGRLLVLDDWAHHVPLVKKLVESALEFPKPPAAPPLSEVGAKSDGAGEIVGEKLVGRVSALVDDLGAGDFGRREAAMASLQELGLPAVQLAEELGGDDPEVAARLARLRSLLTPAPMRRGNQGEKEEPSKKHLDAAGRVATSAEKLDRAGIPHEVADVFVDGGGIPLPALRIRFPVR